MLEQDAPQGVPPDRDEFADFGKFDPLEAKRLLKHFETEGVRFYVQAEERLGPSPRGSVLRRYSHIRIFVHSSDRNKAENILREDWKL
jgi:hypothetical protein